MGYPIVCNRFQSCSHHDACVTYRLNTTFYRPSHRRDAPDEMP